MLAIFASRLLNGRPPLIFEDGAQRRDFVTSHDVARACRLALERRGGGGPGVQRRQRPRYTVREIAEAWPRAVGKRHLEPQITGSYRAGDIRHCFADITRARAALGFEPKSCSRTAWASSPVARRPAGDDRVAEAAPSWTGGG